jgi:hypothetical protein
LPPFIDDYLHKKSISKLFELPIEFSKIAELKVNI